MLPLALLLLSAPLAAQQVYKCTVDGQSVYQSLPCAAEHDTGVQRPIVSDPKLTPQERYANEQMLRNARRRMQAEAGRGAAPVRGTVIEHLADPEACDNARWRGELANAFGKTRTEADKRQAATACRRP